MGIELKATLKTRKLLILLNEKNAKNTGFAQGRYMRPPEVRFKQIPVILFSVRYVAALRMGLQGKGRRVSPFPCRICVGRPARILLAARMRVHRCR